MPRFFFHLYDDAVWSDEEERELPSAEVARSEAIKSAQEMACAEVLAGRLNLGHRIEVADERGRVIHLVRFRDVVEVED